MAIYKAGIVHGRFQPFHKGHLNYVLAALDCFDDLVIGITDPEPIAIVEEIMDSNHHLPCANLFTYYERLEMIRESLLDTIKLAEFQKIKIVPFPIHHMDRWHFYLPMEATHLVYVRDSWDREKADRFESMGYEVILIDWFAQTQITEISGAMVREMMQKGDDRFYDHIPDGTRRTIEKYGLLSRLRAMSKP